MNTHLPVLSTLRVTVLSWVISYILPVVVRYTSKGCHNWMGQLSRWYFLVIGFDKCFSISLAMSLDLCVSMTEKNYCCCEIFEFFSISRVAKVLIFLDKHRQRTFKLETDISFCLSTNIQPKIIKTPITLHRNSCSQKNMQIIYTYVRNDDP
jgi:hypothetical protein